MSEDLNAAFAAFRTAFEKAIAAQLAGNSEPFKALWSHKPDIMIFGAQGGMVGRKSATGSTGSRAGFGRA